MKIPGIRFGLRMVLVAACVAFSACTGAAPSQSASSAGSGGSSGSNSSGSTGGTGNSPAVYAPKIAAGFYQTCRIFTDGSLKCWGANYTGQLGQGSNTFSIGGLQNDIENLQPVNLGTGRAALDVTIGRQHTCALLDNHSVKCWGGNSFGQLGYGDTLTRGINTGEMGDYLPTVDLGTGRTALAVSAGEYHTCALLDDFSVKCWGANTTGQLGLDDTRNRGMNPGEMGDFLPKVFLGNERLAVAVSAGGSHTCAVLDDNSVKCWGLNSDGQLGIGTTIDVGASAGDMAALQPVPLGSNRFAISVAAGEDFTCALLDNGTVKCWGSNFIGQLGQNSTISAGGLPNQLGDNLPSIWLGAGRSVVSLSVHWYHACALLDDQSMKCWGDNALGELGQEDFVAWGSTTAYPGNMSFLNAISLGSDRTVVQIATGTDHDCAILDNGDTKCWGGNPWGQLGLDDFVNRGGSAGQMGNNLAAIQF